LHLETAAAGNSSPGEVPITATLGSASGHLDE
jgi:hypothetical protein